MSYDVWLTNPDDEKECSESHNYTNNAGKLFYKHLEGGIPGLDGLLGSQALMRIRAFWMNLERERIDTWINGVPGEPTLCERYDAPNGWGSLIGALIFLAKIQGECEKYPYWTVRVCA